MTRPMFPPAVDDTIMSTFRSCPHKAFRQYMEHWKPKAESVHLVAGGAFAKGLEVARRAYFERVASIPDVKVEFSAEKLQDVRTITWNDTPFEGSTDDAVALGAQALMTHYGDFECPPESAKSLERTLGALEFYFSQYPLGADGMLPHRLPSGRYAIEYSFAHPLPIKHPVTGDPILYTGRCDMLPEFAGGLYVEDDKTTSSLGASWSRQWEMRSQFTGYVWAAQEDGLDVKGAIVRGVSILKTKYDTQQAITYRSPYEVDRWFKQLCADLQRLIAMWEAGYYDFSLGNACNDYGGCSFTQICKSADPEAWLPTYFEKRVWDPLARKELTVKEWEDLWRHNG